MLDNFKNFLERVDIRSIIGNHKKMFYNNISGEKTNENTVFEFFSIIFSLLFSIKTLDYYLNFKTLLDFQNHYNSLISDLINIESIFIGLFSGAIFGLIAIDKKYFSKNGVITLKELMNSLLYFILLSILIIIYSFGFKLTNNNIIMFLSIFFLYYYLTQQSLLVFIFLKRINFLLNDKE